MHSRLVSLFVVVVLFIGFLPSTRAEDEPKFLDKKLSFWIGLLEDGKTAKDRRKGVIAVEQIGYAGSKKVIPALIKALREDKEPVVRIAATRAAGRTAAKAYADARLEKKEEPRLENVRDALVAALRTEKVDEVREAAALALGDLGPDGRGAVGALAGALKDKHVPTVKAAAASLRRMGSEAHDAQTELEQLLANKGGDLEARLDAAIALGQIKPDVAQVLPVLREVLTDGKSNPRVRKTVAETLGKLGKEAAGATNSLAEVLVAKDTPSDLRLAAVTSLDLFGVDAKAGIPSLIQVVKDPALIKLMGDNSRFIRCIAMHALSRMGKELDSKRAEAVQAILVAVDDSTTEVCVTALEALGTIAADGFGGENEAVKKKIDTILLREGRKSVRDAAEAAKAKMSPTKKEK